MDFIATLPQPAGAAVWGAGLGGAASWMLGSESLLTDAIMFGAVSGLGAFAGPLVTDDPMMRLGVSAATGVGTNMLMGGRLSAMGVALNGGIPAAALYAVQPSGAK